MADPLEALKKAQTIGADPGPHPEGDWLGTAVQGLLGAIGLGDSSSQANRGGQLAASVVPLLSSGVKLPRILEEVFAANPAARGAYERMLESQGPEVLAAKRAANEARLDELTRTNQALTNVASDSPQMIPTETGHAIAIPIPQKPQLQKGIGLGGFESKFSPSLRRD